MKLDQTCKGLVDENFPFLLKLFNFSMFQFGNKYTFDKCGRNFIRWAGGFLLKTNISVGYKAVAEITNYGFGYRKHFWLQRLHYSSIRFSVQSNGWTRKMNLDLERIRKPYRTY